MILNFSTKHPDGTPSDFVRKVWAGLILHGVADIGSYYEYCLSRSGEHQQLFGYDTPEFHCFYVQPKLHTIRKINKRVWKIGDKIHPYVFSRSKNMFQFAPAVEVTYTRYIRIYRSKCAAITGVIMPLSASLTTHRKPVLDEIEWDLGGTIGWELHPHIKTYFNIYDTSSIKEKRMEVFCQNDGLTLEQFDQWFTEPGDYQLISWIPDFEY